MRHLIDPLDFTEEETTRILDLAERISLYPDATVMLPITRSSLHFSMSQVPEPVYLLSLPC